MINGPRKVLFCFGPLWPLVLTVFFALFSDLPLVFVGRVVMLFPVDCWAIHRHLFSALWPISILTKTLSNVKKTKTKAYPGDNRDLHKSMSTGIHIYWAGGYYAHLNMIKLNLIANDLLAVGSG